ncbi:MAG: flagellar biosynthesis repressor FlbT [bacterium]|nr:flagellar biosynthesis repressor FlbT [bacterium]MDY2830804.1 flagellar biosynthesis repressor FlbT [Alphaproteobacteria bacterium]
MPLKIELKPHECIIIGDALITNDNDRVRFYIDGNVPILREKFILREKDATTPARRVYFVVQQLYLTKGSAELQKLFIEYIRDLQEAAPSLHSFVAPVAESVLINDYYAAIKNAAKLVEQEDKVFGKALQGEDAPADGV